MSPPTPRQVAVAIIVEASSLSVEPKFLLVASRKHAARWVFPKGGIEEGEDSQEAAEREAWEEAGLVVGTAMHLDHLITLLDPQPHKKSPSTDPSSPSFVPSTDYSFEIFVLGSTTLLSDTWPEKDERGERKWVQGWKELEALVAWGRRGELMTTAVQKLKGRLS